MKFVLPYDREQIVLHYFLTAIYTAFLFFNYLILTLISIMMHGPLGIVEHIVHKELILIINISTEKWTIVRYAKTEKANDYELYKN